jgi:thiol-disulfide isomerase/thioredoxin
VKRIWIVGAVVVTLGVAGALWGRPAAPGRRALPEVAFFDAQGRETKPADFSGKVVVLDFWASWCLPCRQEMPAFDRMQQKFGPRGLVIVAVSIDQRGLPAVDAFYADIGLTHLGRYIDPTREAARKIGFMGIPSAVVIDRHGREAARIEGPINWESGRIANLLSRLLDEN